MNPTLPARQSEDVYKCMLRNGKTHYTVEQESENYVCKDIANQLSKCIYCTKEITHANKRYY